MASLPTRCFTCGKIISSSGHLETFLERISNGINQKNVLDDLGYRRMCCRRMFLSYPHELDEMMLLYPSIHDSELIPRESNPPSICRDTSNKPAKNRIQQDPKLSNI